MRLCLHIGPDPWVSTRVQDTLARNRDRLKRHGILVPRSPGTRNHTRLFMAVSDHVDAFRFHRGHDTQAGRDALGRALAKDLAEEIAAARPHTLVLSAHHLGSHVTGRGPLESLARLLPDEVASVEVLAHVEAPSQMLARHYAQQVFAGRARSLALERGLLAKPSTWWDQALETAPAPDPRRGVFPEVQMVPAFLDLRRWTGLWETVFGSGCMRLRHGARADLAGRGIAARLRIDLGLDCGLEAADAVVAPTLPSAEWLDRARCYNDLLLRRLRSDGMVPTPRLLRKWLNDMRVGGPPLDPRRLAAVDAYFAADLAELAATHPELADLVPEAPHQDGWPEEPAPTAGFRASQYLLANLGQITAPGRTDTPAQTPEESPSGDLPAAAVVAYHRLLRSPFVPHNRLTNVDESAPAPPFESIGPVIPRAGRGAGNSGITLVACMKNEAPYILEWIAYHRAIGVDHFLIYTNDCADGTVEMLSRLAELGLVEHRDNGAWAGKSPQHHALKRAHDEALVRDAAWVAHIDVDEFINVRCGNGTLPDLINRLPEATNIAMTWRLFGHNGVTRLDDALVITQFDRCAPQYCPKPHTAWGFKTLFRNIGAYGRLSCHRPNQLKPDREAEVCWVNGSGKPMGDAVKSRGWRNSRGTIGYDLVQLNHYALRSAESFLIKRQRGRALHVDREIGLDYWVRMDWSDACDRTIQRNLPRVQAARQALLQDTALAHWHAQGLAWHRDRAAALRASPEFSELFEQAVALRLTAAERAAYALSMTMES